MIKDSYKTDNSGFTLLELIAVVTIIAIFSVTVIPRIDFTSDSKIKGTARHMRNLISYLYDISQSTDIVLRLEINKLEGNYKITSLKIDQEKSEFVKTSFPLARDASFPSNVTVNSVYISNIGESNADISYIHFIPEGFVDFAIVRFENDSGHKLSLIVNPLTGRSRIEEGFFYVDKNET